MHRNLTLIQISLVASLSSVTIAMAAPRPPAAAKPTTVGDVTSLIVSPAWLAAHLDDPDLVLLHIGDADAYRGKHIKGARHVALSDISIAMQADGGLHLEMLPADDLRRRLEALGISNDSRIVVYFGEDWVSPATRVVFTLDAAGLGARTALLDGGMPAWVRDGHAVTDAAPPARTGKLAPLTMPPVIVGATTVLSSLGKPGFAVVDARDKTFYDGTATGNSHERKHRTGHIAGALSIPFDSVFDDQLVLRSPDDLKARFTKAGVRPGDTVIGYCHIGQQATAMLFAARRLGYPVLLYDGSFEDWSLFHPAYPVETVPEAPEKTIDKTIDKTPEKTIDKAREKTVDKGPGKAPNQAAQGKP